MKTLFEFIIRNSFLFLFLLLEFTSIVLAIQYNEPHKTKYISSANIITASIFEKKNAVTQYFNLVRVNKSLAEENAKLKNFLPSSFSSNIPEITFKRNSIFKQQYSYITATVINNSINKQKNFLTLDKGSRHGIEKDMAVVGPNGIVGIIWNVSENFSTAMSVLHIDYKVSAKFNKNHYFGSILWDGNQFDKVKLLEIPYHVDVKQGDIITTTAFSNIYPAGIPIGYVSEYTRSKHENFYDITVQLATDFKNLEHVYIINDLLKAERKNLENQLTQ